VHDGKSRDRKGATGEGNMPEGKGNFSAVPRRGYKCGARRTTTSSLPNELDGDDKEG